MERLLWFTWLCAVMTAGSANACTRSSPVSSEEMVKLAGLIVRATANSYESPPRDSNLWTNDLPDSVVLFQNTGSHQSTIERTEPAAVQSSAESPV